MSEPELPKKNTIGITYTEGFIKDEHFEHILESVLGIPEEEVFAIDSRGEGKFVSRLRLKQGMCIFVKILWVEN